MLLPHMDAVFHASIALDNVCAKFNFIYNASSFFLTDLALFTYFSPMCSSTTIVPRGNGTVRLQSIDYYESTA